MGKQVHPAVAAIVLLIALGAVWFCYTYIWSGKTVGSEGPPKGVSMSPGVAGPGERGPAPPEHRGLPGKDGKPAQPKAGTPPSKAPAPG